MIKYISHMHLSRRHKNTRIINSNDTLRKTLSPRAFVVISPNWLLGLIYYFLTASGGEASTIRNLSANHRTSTNFTTLKN